MVAEKTAKTWGATFLPHPVDVTEAKAWLGVNAPTFPVKRRVL